MIQKIVDVLVNKQSKNQVMTDEDEKIYRYGYVLLCEVFFNIIIALAIGIVFSRTKELIIQNIMLLLQLIKHRNGIKTLKNIEKH